MSRQPDEKALVGDIGLRTRMRGEERRISSQHRQLDVLFAAVFDALRSRGVHVASAEFLRFADALEAHLSLEESIYFPALHGLRPDLAPELSALVGQHDEIRSAVAAVRALLESGERETTSDRLDALADTVADHEAEEEELIARISSGPLAGIGRSVLTD